ncbi:MAG: DNA-processing protein DprA [Paracoccaceae bacterium]|nr:MAG: DNA-processing protein DprA [Paracoccaceae bacterium]
MDEGFDEPAATYDPPGDPGARLDWLRLIRSRRVGPATFHRLMAAHGTARAALAALPGIAAVAGVADYEPCPEGVVRAEAAAARRVGARLVCRGEADYPGPLARIADAPPCLWLRGDARHLARPMVALVGARNASSLGLRMARRLAEGLAEAGFTVVSGLARGIDAEAHQGAMAGGTVAVLAGGVDIAYPPENTALLAELAERGCVLSEVPVGTEPQARHFPQRNRIVSGLSRAVVVVEAAARSGSLLTARAALDQGREVLAVPGHPFDARAAGCNQLIREGATLVRSVADVVEAIGAGLAVPPVAAMPPEPPRPPLPGPVPARRPLTDVAQVHARILSRLGPSPLPEDQLIRDLAMPAALVAPELLTLEMEGRVLRAPGGLLSRAV